MLSEDGARLLAELKTVPGGKLCVACISSRLGLDHWVENASPRQRKQNGRGAVVRSNSRSESVAISASQTR